MIATTQPTTKLKPVIRWAGNKYGTPVADRVAQLFAPYRRTHLYVDPFAGALGMGLHLRPDKAIFGDYSREMVALHQWIKSGGKIDPSLWPEHTSKAQYFEYRSVFNRLQVTQDPSRVYGEEFLIRMLWLLHHCFNGLWRNNDKGLYNVPGGGSNGRLLNQPIPDLSRWTEAYSRYNWQFFCTDFEEIDNYVAIDSWTNRCKGQFTYVDPPYHGTFSKYNANDFSWDDQVRLADWLAKKQGPVVASNSDHPDIVDLYRSRSFEVEFVEVARSMSPKGDRTPAIEMLAYKNI